jgi:4-amino-4-deoxy-L-arabinose transferase-like glycosyltransferase
VRSFPTSPRLAETIPVWFPVTILAAWVSLAAMLNSSQFGDNIEQYVWAHGMVWGYWKHPPLPTFLIAALIRAVGPSVYWSYALAAFCFSGTALFTWKIAERMIGLRLAAVAVLLLGLQLNFSWRAQIYNHNSLLILLVSAAVWSALVAAYDRRSGAWLLAGTFAGLAMLTKYQAIVPLLGLLGALWLSGAFKVRNNVIGAILAVLVAALVFLPHVHWLVTNDFAPFTYASKSVQHLPLSHRFGTLARFLFTELRILFPGIACLGVFALYVKRRPPAVEGAAGMAKDVAAIDAKPWMLMLVGFPLLFLSGMALFGGMHLEGHWTLQTFQFLPIWLAQRLGRRCPRIDVRRFWHAAILVHVISMASYVLAFTGLARSTAPGNDRAYPAKALADIVVADWEKVTACPLKYVVGPSFEAGMISVYSGLSPAVLEEGDFHKSPWVEPKDLARSGAVYVERSPRPSASQGEMAIPPRIIGDEIKTTIYWTVVPPASPCH